MTTANPVEGAERPGEAGAASSRGTPLLVSGIVLMVLGVLTAVIASVGLFSSGSGLIDAFRADPIQVPGQGRLDLEPATYSVLQLSDGTSYKLAPGDIEVTGPDGALTVTEPGVSETLDRNGKVYESVARFRVASAGSHTVTLTSAGTGEVIISQSIGSTLRRSAVWLVLFGLAGLMGLVGLGLLIFGIVRRSAGDTPVMATPMAAAAVAPAAPTPPASAAPMPPAAWYPDPEHAGRQRYWDGTAWTDHRA